MIKPIPSVHPGLGIRRPAALALFLGMSIVPRAQADDAVSVSAHDLSAKFAIDENDPERSVPTEAEAMKNPLEMGYLMMDMIARAEAATQRGDHAAAVRYYRGLAKAVPARAVSFSKLCKAYEALGDDGQALQSCREALGKGGVTVDDHARYVRLSLKQTAPLDTEKIEELDAIVTHVREQLKEDPQGPVVAALLACEIATRLEHTERLRTCTRQLTKLLPNDPRSVAFSWALAIREHDWDAGERLIAKARQAGLPAPAIGAMEAQLAAERDKGADLISLVRQWGLLGGLVLAIGLGMLLVARRKDGLRTA